MANLNHILRQEHLRAGLEVIWDEDFLQLQKNNLTIAVFTCAASDETILLEADKYLEEAFTFSV